ncbi:hypothetical protein D918_00635 [Trichuris suis]|nr:hypothetical protein D918_00635 [Trichuris suis]
MSVTQRILLIYVKVVLAVLAIITNGALLAVMIRRKPKRYFISLMTEVVTLLLLRLNKSSYSAIRLVQIRREVAVMKQTIVLVTFVFIAQTIPNTYKFIDNLGYHNVFWDRFVSIGTSVEAFDQWVNQQVLDPLLEEAVLEGVPSEPEEVLASYDYARISLSPYGRSSFGHDPPFSAVLPNNGDKALTLGTTQLRIETHSFYLLQRFKFGMRILVPLLVWFTTENDKLNSFEDVLLEQPLLQHNLFMTYVLCVICLKLGHKFWLCKRHYYDYSSKARFLRQGTERVSNFSFRKYLVISGLV